VPGVTKTLLDVCQRGHLNDYVTAIAWSPNQTLAIASAAGEILLVNPETQAEILLQEAKGESIDCLAFSSDGHYLAAGGQSGHLLIWHLTFPLTHPPPFSSRDAPRTTSLLLRSRYANRTGIHPSPHRLFSPIPAPGLIASPGTLPATNSPLASVAMPKFGMRKLKKSPLQFNSRTRQYSIWFGIPRAAI
jgi:hypothetical protein